MGKFRSAKEENNFTMLPFSLLIVGAYATQEPSMTEPNCWIANDNAPYCGCQFITRDFNMINSTCTATFEDGRAVHMMSVASSFILNMISDSTGKNNGGKPKFAWTGYEGESHENLHDMLWFFEPEECEDPLTGLKNITFDSTYHPTIKCEDYGGEWMAPLLGNFNYDIARSVQQYNLPIKNLGQGQVATIQINELSGSPVGLQLKNVTSHAGHGTAVADDCTNGGLFTYEQNADHWGDLEYATFSLCGASCWPDKPNDYCFEVPSPWDSTIVVA